LSVATGPLSTASPSALVRLGTPWWFGSGAMVPKAALVGVGLIAMSAMPVAAHDIYSTIKNNQGVSCCDGTDCRPVHYRIKWGGVQMLIEGVWFPISQEMVEYRDLDDDTSTTNGGHWCGKIISSTILHYDYLKTYCAFIPPSLM
jgi:hypothetical protein